MLACWLVGRGLKKLLLTKDDNISKTTRDEILNESKYNEKFKENWQKHNSASEMV